MIKKNLKTMVITSIIILLPMLAGLLLWNQLPNEVATHFDGDGVANGWSSKAFAVFGLPIFLLALHWFCVCFTSADPKKANISDKMMVLVLWIVPVISLAGNGSIYIYALNNTVNTTSVGMLLLGCMLLVVGNYLPKMKQSYTLGIKTPWTLNSEENWNRTHRMSGWLFMLGGIVVLIMAIMECYELSMVVILMVALMPVVYSYYLYKKGI